MGLRLVSLWALTCLLGSGLGLGCGPGPNDDGGAGTQTSGGTDGGTSPGGTGSGTASGGASGGPTPPATETGGLGCGEVPCEKTSYCDWAGDSCGATWDTATCTPRPDACAEIYMPVCGCDGQIHGNACEAAASGVDVSTAGGCEPPETGQVPCGPMFCGLGTYCQILVSDVAGEPNGYQCPVLPGGCGDAPTCACLQDEPCYEFGCEAADGGLQISCPGG